ncbi:VanZ family protein [Cellulomonas sp. NS3]|uniref:VanZ family protein n=1 Tax=Cellulomonas sp. NS3 TaxID=2973977 RepID=UPI0021616961|nr:VanZ family protein [Cellulomonas sp. NS3]
MTTRTRHLTRAALVVWLLLVAWITLTPDLADNDALGKVKVITQWLTARGIPVTYAGVEAGANVVMFGPFGVLVGLLVRPARAWWARVVAGGLVLSAGIETAQLLFLPTRVPTVQDVVMNTLGAALGVVVLVVGHRLWLARRARRSAGSPSDDARAPLAAGAGEARVRATAEG